MNPNCVHENKILAYRERDVCELSHELAVRGTEE